MPRRGCVRLFSLVVLAGTACANEPLGVGSAPTLSLEGPNVIRHTQRRPILERLLIQGARSEGGVCGFTHSVRLGGGQEVFESLLEYDPDTCRFIIARHPVDSALAATKWVPGVTPGRPGRPSGAPSADYESQTTDVETELPPPGGGLSPSNHDYCSSHGQIGPDHWGSQKMYFDDPIGIRVTRSDLDFYFMNDLDYQCVTYAHSYLLSEWYRTSGWYLTQHEHYQGPADTHWTWMRAIGYQTMRNDAFGDIFCQGYSTWTHYNPNEVRMFWDGYTTFDWNYYAVGGCSSWLTPYRYAWAF